MLDNEPVSQYEVLVNSAQLGDEARKFVKSGIGKFLISRIDDQVTDALHMLRNVDPHDYKLVMKYQNDIRVAEVSKYFLLDAINTGFNSLRELEQGEEMELRNDFSGFTDDLPQQGEEEWQ